MVSLIEAAKYPFTAKASDKMREYAVSLDLLVKEEYKPVIERAKQRIETSIIKGVIEPTFDDAKTELLSYSVAFLFVEYINDTYLKRRWAHTEAERSYQFLTKDNIGTIFLMAEDQFKWQIQATDDVEVDGVKHHFRIFFTDYLRNSVMFNEPKWKLVNRVMSDGFLPLTKEETVRLLMIETEEFMLNRLFTDRSIGMPMELQLEALGLERFLINNRPEFNDDLPVNLEAVPPCIAKMLRRLKAGFNLTHTERFGMTAFMLKIGLDKKTVTELFNVSPDFREDLTSYQVGQISERDYLPPSCKSLKTSRLCEEEDTNYCKKSKNPINYYAMKNFILEKRK